MVADERGRGIFQLRAKPDTADMDSLNVRETGAHPPSEFKGSKHSSSMLLLSIFEFNILHRK